MVGGGALLSTATGAVLSEVDGAQVLLAMMLLTSLLGFLAALPYPATGEVTGYSAPSVR